MKVLKKRKKNALIDSISSGAYANKMSVSEYANHAQSQH